MLWFPAFYLAGACLSESLNPNDYDKWTDNDMDWTNTETERINLIPKDFLLFQLNVIINRTTE